MEEEETREAVKSPTAAAAPPPHSSQLSVLQRQCSQLNESSGYTSGLEESAAAGSSSATISVNEDVLIFRAMYDYQASHDDELSLTRGAEIRVLSKRTSDEGWWLGVCISDGRKGIFPSNYVEPVVSSSCTKPVGSSSLPVESSDDLGPDMPPVIPYSSLEFRDCIGAGGFGKVFRGTWRRPANDDGELVAIKEARIEGDKDDLIDSIKQSVLQEAKLFWQLRHPNIIQLKGICLQEPHFCLIMEYAKGGSLGRLLSMRKIGFPPYILIKWALQVSQGMLYLHEQALLPSRTPIIHRDLKSSNILLSEEIGCPGAVGNGAEHRLAEIQLKLTDFGLARELQKTTNVMNAAGTYSHMPPEVIKNSTYSKASDVWSFGVLLWELLTGEVPYKGIDPLAIAYGVAVDKLKLPIPSSCPAILSELIHGCWHTDPHHRLTFLQIIERLREIESSPFATTPNDTFWVMQQDWKCEIEEMFGEIRLRETQLRSREEELERVSMRQQAYEYMLRQRERALEEREKDLVVRELSVALQQQLGAATQVPPEPKKRRKVGGRLLTSFLRSSSSNSNAAAQNAAAAAALSLTNTPHTGSNTNLPANHRSFEISSPSDFQHCFSIQPEVLTAAAGLKASTPTAENETDADHGANGATANGGATSSNHILISPVGSPSLRLKIMLPGGSGDKRSIGLVHQKTLSPYSSRERIPPFSIKSNSIDNSDNSTVGQQQSSYYLNLSNMHAAKSPQLQSASNTPRLSQKHQPHASRAKYQKSNSIWYTGNEEEISKRSCSADVSQQLQVAEIQLPQSQAAMQPPPSQTSGTKKLTRILYEIGSILSFVGLGKDYKQSQQSQHLKKPMSQSTRRSQDKKHTPSTSSSSIHQANANPSEPAGSERLSSSPSKSSTNQLLTPTRTGTGVIGSSPGGKHESQSLTRHHRCNQYRFKSLSSHHSSTIALDSAEGELGAAPHLVQNLSLSPASAIVASAAATASSLSAAQMSNSSSNLLSPRVHSNFIPKNQYLVENQKRAQAADSQQQAMLKQMQKKYSKSVDCTHYLDAVPSPSPSNRSMLLSPSTARATAPMPIIANANSATATASNLLSSTPAGSSSRISCSSGSNLGWPGSAEVDENSVENSRSNLNSMKLVSSTEYLNKERLQTGRDSIKSSSPASSLINLPNPKVQRQHSQNSPLIPRRNDYEPVARVTIQRQQRVDLGLNENSPPKSSNERLYKNFSFSNETNILHPMSQSRAGAGAAGLASSAASPSLSPKLGHSNQAPIPPAIHRPITLDLTKAFGSVATSATSYTCLKQNDSIGLSTTSDDDFLAGIVDEAAKAAAAAQQPAVKWKDASMSLSSSSSPMTSSPRLLPRQPSNSSASTRPFLTPSNKFKSQSSDTSSS